MGSRTVSFSNREATRKCDDKNKEKTSGKKTQLVGRTYSLRTEFASYGHSERAPGTSNSYVRAAMVATRPRRSPSASGSADMRRSGLSSAYQASAWRRWRKEKQAANRRQNERNLSMFAKAASNKEVRHLYRVSILEY